MAVFFLGPGVNFGSSPSDDTIYGSAANDTFTSGGGDDTVYGGAGSDTIALSAGHNTLFGGPGADRLVIDGYSGPHTFADYQVGIDKIDFSSTTFQSSDVRTEDRGADKVVTYGWIEVVLTGQAGAQIDGNDMVFGPDPRPIVQATTILKQNNLSMSGSNGVDHYDLEGAGNTLYANGLDDVVYESARFANTVFGGIGNDSLSSSDSRGSDPNTQTDVLDGGAGDDRIESDGPDDLYGGAGDDLLLARDTGVSRLFGGAGADTFVVSSIALQAGRVTIVDFEPGIDVILSAPPSLDDTLYGSAVNDAFFGKDGLDDGNDQLFGNGGDDQLFGDAGNDLASGGSGNDFLDGFVGADSLIGDSGSDTVFAGAGNDYGSGDEGADTLYGGDGNDSLQGGAESDTVYGGRGDDLIAGGAGDDTLFGGLNGISTKWQYALVRCGPRYGGHRMGNAEHHSQLR